MIDYLQHVLMPLSITFGLTIFVGLERQNIGKSAGVSAHILIAMACCAIALMQQRIFDYEISLGKSNAEGQRIIAQVVTGVGFIGAGVILKSTKSVKGLTTAGTLFACAMTGLIIGMGYYAIGISLGLFVIVFMYSRDLVHKINPFKSKRKYVNGVEVHDKNDDDIHKENLDN